VHTLRIEHAIGDYDAWKKAFDRDPAHRRQSGVLRYRVLRPECDRHHVMIDLDFDTANQAQAFLRAMQQVWRSREAAPALSGEVQARVLEAIECRELQASEAP
jgi:hypothetical protein